MDNNSRYPLCYTAEQVEARTSDYLCFACGMQFLTDRQLDRADVVTCSISPCGLCGQEVATTHYRHFNWLRIGPEPPSIFQS